MSHDSSHTLGTFSEAGQLSGLWAQANDLPVFPGALRKKCCDCPNEETSTERVSGSPKVTQQVKGKPGWNRI